MTEHTIRVRFDAQGNALFLDEVPGVFHVGDGLSIVDATLKEGDTFTIPPPKPKWWERPLIALRLRKPPPFTFKITGVVTAK